jgi:protein-S-isoprenylcysteine O-methyltransferase Ste14
MKGRDHAGVWVPPPVLFVTPLVIAVAIQTLRPMMIFQASGRAAPLAGLIAVAIGVAIGLSSVASFRSAKTTILPAGRPTTAIVERGPYRFTRNPMYLAMAVSYCGFAIVMNNLWALAFLPVVVAVVDHFVIRREERYLTAKFGDAYSRYCLRVRRWM